MATAVRAQYCRKRKDDLHLVPKSARWVRVSAKSLCQVTMIKVTSSYRIVLDVNHGQQMRKSLNVVLLLEFHGDVVKVDTSLEPSLNNVHYHTEMRQSRLLRKGIVRLEEGVVSTSLREDTTN